MGAADFPEQSFPGRVEVQVIDHDAIVDARAGDVFGRILCLMRFRHGNLR
jgi:hypothetical protein